MIKKLLQLTAFLENNPLTAGLILLLFSIVFFSIMQSALVFPDPDSFYHTKMAVLMTEQGIIKDFNNLPFTIFQNYYIDHHFLYHVYLMPFVYFLPPLAGAKLGQTILTSLLILTFFWLLKKLKIKWAFWFTLLLFSAPAFVFRISLVKAQPLSIIILLLGIYFILSKKYRSLFCLAFVYVWTYDGWFLLLIISMLYIFINSWQLTTYHYHKKWLDNILTCIKLKKKTQIKNFIITWIKNCFSPDNLKLFSAVFLGLLAGIIFNPYFPQNLDFFYVHILKIGLLNFNNPIAVGAEWYPFTAWEFVKAMAIIFIIFIISGMIFLNRWKKFGLATKYLASIAFLFILSAVKSRRNIEYFIPMAVLFSATVFTAGFKIKEVRRDLQQIKKILYLKEIWSSRFLKYFLSAVIFTSLLAGIIGLAITEKTSISSGYGLNYLQNASNFLQQNSQAGDIVFHNNWDEFPILFYNNNKNKYIIGLDPTFLYYQNPDLYYKWLDTINGKNPDEVYNIIKNDFQAKFVLIAKRNQKMLKNIANNFYFTEIYDDNEATIYKVN
ncbi:MAG: hypothetical protein WCP18_02590 [bacterium]